MTPAETTAMLQGTPNCSLATLDRDGYPHLVAMSFALDADGNIVMTSFGKAQKVINLQRNPKVAVMVEHGTAYDKIKGVMIRGRAEVVEGAEAVLAGDEAGGRQDGAAVGQGDRAERGGDHRGVSAASGKARCDPDPSGEMGELGPFEAGGRGGCGSDRKAEPMS
jgi:Pyridoxamine 5'-phosphate oxidase